MASRSKARQRAASRATTDPKGAPTASQRSKATGPTRRAVAVQWVIVGAAVVGLVVIALIFAEPGNSLHGG